MDDLKAKLKQFSVAFLIIMICGTIGFMTTEGLSPTDAFYFTIVTVATVGYGDIHPSSLSGKILAMVLIACGVTTFLGVVANATDIMMNRRDNLARIQ